MAFLGTCWTSRAQRTICLAALIALAPVALAGTANQGRSALAATTLETAAPQVVNPAEAERDFLPTPSYADLVGVLETAPLVWQVQLRKQVALDPQQAKGLRPGWIRAYIEAQPLASLHGPLTNAKSIAFLADLPAGTGEKLPDLTKHRLLIAARAVPDHPEMVQLVAPDALFAWDAGLEAQMRDLIAQLAAPDAPPAITGVREAIHVAGALAGAGETQIFLATRNGSPAALTVTRVPNQPPGWSVSFSELADATGAPPPHDSLAWYRLACFLPPALPNASNVSATPEDQDQAAQDYLLVIGALGPCLRRLG